MNIKQIIKNHFNLFAILLFIILSIFLVLPFRNFIFVNFDLPFHLAPLNEIYSNISAGNLNNINPSISTKVMGKIGYPQNLFYPNLFYFPLIIFKSFFSLYTSFLLFMVVIFLFIFLSMYFITNKINNNNYSSLFASLIYGMSGYLLIDTFEMQDISQAIAYIFIPIAFYGMYQVLHEDYKKWYILSVGFTCLILTHILSALLMFILIIMSLGMLFLNNEKGYILFKRILYLIFSGIISIGLSAFFLFPLIQNHHYVKNMMINMPKLWGNAININNLAGGLPLHYDIFQLLILICCIFFISKFSDLFKYMLVEILVILFVTTNLFPWDLFQSIFGILQFPWRFIVIFSFLIALLSAQWFKIVFNDDKKYINKVIIIILLIIFECFSYLSMVENVKRNNTSLRKNEFTNKTSVIANYDYFPKDSEPIVKDIEKHSIPKMNPKLNIKQTKWITSYDAIHYRVDSKHNYSDVVIPNIYYPGFHAYVNNQEKSIHVDKHRAINIPLHKGTNKVDIVYQKTNVQIVSLWISIISWISLIGYLVYKKIKYNK